MLGTTRAAFTKGLDIEGLGRRGTARTAVDITTTAKFMGWKRIRVTIPFEASDFRDPSSIRPFHKENGVGVDRTDSANAFESTITALVTSVSPFVTVSWGEGTSVSLPRP